MWFRRRKHRATIFTGEKGLAELHEDIFSDPVSIEWLLHLRRSFPQGDWDRSEWVMCLRTWRRICRMQTEGLSAQGLAMEVLRLLHEGDCPPKILYGRPVVISEVDKLHLRVQETGENNDQRA